MSNNQKFANKKVEKTQKVCTSTKIIVPKNKNNTNVIITKTTTTTTTVIKKQVKDPIPKTNHKPKPYNFEPTYQKVNINPFLNGNKTQKPRTNWTRPKAPAKINVNVTIGNISGMAKPNQNKAKK